jgi:hypothetical protein
MRSIFISLVSKKWPDQILSLNEDQIRGAK